jgi:hypothetical protein
MSIQNSVVAIYSTHAEADHAVKELQRSGVDMHKLSILGKGYHTDEHVVGYYNTGDRMKYWGKVGAFWGGFWRLSVRIRSFYDSGPGANPGGRPCCWLDCGRFGRCGGGRSFECFGSRPSTA